LTYTDIIEEYYIVHHYSDVQFVEPWIAIDDYIKNGCKELNWTLEELLTHKKVS
jgi:hypothetical protein